MTTRDENHRRHKCPDGMKTGKIRDFGGKSNLPVASLVKCIVGLSMMCYKIKKPHRYGYKP